MADEPQLVMVDGREALGYVIVRPKAGTDPQMRQLDISVASAGLSYGEMAYILGQAARKFADAAQKQQAERQGWDRADFQCGGCGAKLGPFRTEVEYIQAVAEHKAGCTGAAADHVGSPGTLR